MMAIGNYSIILPIISQFFNQLLLVAVLYLIRHKSFLVKRFMSKVTQPDISVIAL